MKKLLVLVLGLGIGLAAPLGCSSSKDTDPIVIKSDNPRGGAVKQKSSP